MRLDLIMTRIYELGAAHDAMAADLVWMVAPDYNYLDILDDYFWGALHADR
jgi:hypothetical protein